MLKIKILSLIRAGICSGTKDLLVTTYFHIFLTAKMTYSDFQISLALSLPNSNEIFVYVNKIKH
jgi:hypothetical protein